MLELVAAGFLVFLVDRKIDDPGKGETILLGKAQLFADDGAGLAGDLFKGRGLAAKEEGRIAKAKAQLLADRLGALGADILGQRASRFHARAIFGRTPEDIAHARQALFLGEGVHPVAELAAAAGGGGNGADLGALLLEKLGEDRKARAREMLGDHLHLDRVAQVGLVGAIP